MTKTNTADSDKWNNIYRSNNTDMTNLLPATVLQQFQHLLPKQGKALDLACGLGANAIQLAQHGLQTYAWDISSVAISKLNNSARSLNLEILAMVRDIITEPPPQNTFDIIVVSHFLERNIMPAIIAALRQNGLLFYQTFTQHKPRPSTGPSNPKYRLANNELLTLCKDLYVVFYQEIGLITNKNTKLNDQALLIAQRTLYDR